MKKRTQGRETANTASQHKLSDLDVKHYYNNNAISDRSRSKAKQPDGMTMREWRKGPGSKYMAKPSVWLAPRGLNTSGALAGLSASSYPNPVLAPPSSITDIQSFAPTTGPSIMSARPWPNPPMAGPLKQGQVLTAPSYTTQVGAET